MEKKKVLFLITSLALGGAEKHVLSLAKELQVSSEFQPIIASLAQKGNFYTQAIEAGIKVITLKRYFRYDIFISLQVKNILKEQNISILHTHMFYSNIIGRLAAKMAKTPVVIATEHGQSVWKNNILIWLDRKTQNMTDKIITVSNLSRKIRETRERINPTKLITIHNFVNLDEFQINRNTTHNLKEKYNLSGKKIVGMLARLNENKRVQDAIFAIKEVVERYPSIQLVILGDGPLKDQLIQLTKNNHLSNNILFTGFQNNTSEWLSIFDIFLSISIREDFPISILEAMAMQKPVIATNVGGIPEIIDDNSGILVEPQNPSLLAKKILWLLNHHQEAEKMGLAARKIIEKNFSQKVIVPKIISLYKSCLLAKSA